MHSGLLLNRYCGPLSCHAESPDRPKALEFPGTTRLAPWPSELFLRFPQGLSILPITCIAEPVNERVVIMRFQIIDGLPGMLVVRVQLAL